MSSKIVVTRLPDAPRVALTYPNGARTEHADAIEAFREIFAWRKVSEFRVTGMTPTPDGAIVDCVEIQNDERCEHGLYRTGIGSCPACGD